MLLTKLEIKGFKSFADKISINLATKSLFIFVSLFIQTLTLYV